MPLKTDVTLKWVEDKIIISTGTLIGRLDQTIKSGSNHTDNEREANTGILKDTYLKLNGYINELEQGNGFATQKVSSGTVIKTLNFKRPMENTERIIADLEPKVKKLQEMDISGPGGDAISACMSSYSAALYIFKAHLSGFMNSIKAVNQARIGKDVKVA